MSKPKPLDLEKFSLFRILDKKGLIGLGGVIKNFSKLGGWVFIDELIRKEIKQRIKTACEFYLRYKNKPELLMEEHPEYKKQCEYFIHEIEMASIGEFEPTHGELAHLMDYNEWLFKLTFKAVLDDETKIN